MTRPVSVHPTPCEGARGGERGRERRDVHEVQVQVQVQVGTAPSLRISRQQSQVGVLPARDIDEERKSHTAIVVL